jgi:hypothetical protein
MPAGLVAVAAAGFRRGDILGGVERGAGDDRRVDGSGDQSHSERGTARARPPVVRVRPNTMCPVYFGLRRIDRTPESVHPVAGSGGG